MVTAWVEGFIFFDNKITSKIDILYYRNSTACVFGCRDVVRRTIAPVKVLPWVVDGAGGLGAGKTSGAGTRGVDLNAAIGGRTGDSNTNGGESSNNGSKIHVECYPAGNPSL